MNYRNLTNQEILDLENNNCRSINGWDNIFVSPNFSTTNILSVTFSGKNYLGCFSETIILPNGENDISGIYSSHLHNCKISDNVYIKNIGTSISNYFIDKNVVIQNVGSISNKEESQFGNGTVVCPLNEGGGREVIIYNELSAHTAYLMAFYQHDKTLISQLKKIAIKEADKLKSEIGTISQGAIIRDCGVINSTNIGSYATIEGISYLENGTIASEKNAQTHVGHQVNAKDFIISSGSVVSDGANLTHCFVGQGCEISKGYTAENSLFFANSQCLQGEACSIFAGPYTVTHHKSTLLIAGFYSFFNAGSGTNQSNHMYKLGPLHQGIIERGGKTGSDSYVLWPAKIGAFTMVLGRHYGNPDISELPFSYLIEDSGKSILMPAHNIFNVGTTRDVDKWPNRDKRKGDNLIDFIVTEALNPYTIEKILKGIQVLKQLEKKASPTGKVLMYKNTHISLISINRGIKLYEQALVKYVGDELINTLKHTNFDSVKEFDVNTKNQDWVDLSGLICKTEHLNKFNNELVNSNSSTNAYLNKFYKTQYTNYNALKQKHVLYVLKSYFNIDIKSCLIEDIKEFLNGWKLNNDKIKSSILIDAKKEFNIKSKISFGIDGDDSIKEQDFEAVRGSINTSSFTKELEQKFIKLNSIADNIIQTIK